MDLLRCALPASPDPALAEAVCRPRVAHAALEALAEARARPSHATPTLSRFFRARRDLGSKERPAAAEATYGVIRHEGLLSRAGARDDEARLRLWVDLTRGERFEGLASEGPVADYAAALSLPPAVAGEWLDVLGEVEAVALGAALAGRAPLTVRANRARTSRDALAERLARAGVSVEPVAGAPDGLTLLGRHNALALPGFAEGLFEVQDASSQRLVAALEGRLEGQHHVLDLCAGAGGKALALASVGARVRAWDARSHALDELRARAERSGLAGRIRVGPPQPAPMVLVDAPCSGTGRLRRDPALRWGLDPGRHLEAQRALLAQAAGLVEPGGWLVYATCSLLSAENEHAPPGDWASEERVWLWPHREGGDGFFWRVWRRGQG